MPKKHLLSLIIPAYKQEKTITKDITRINETLRFLKYLYEIIVVVDGKLDNTAQKAKALHLKHVKVFEYEKNYGKGYAVRFGMGKAKGDLIAFLDAGMDLDPKALGEMLTRMQEKKVDILIGSKLHPMSKVTYPWQRRVLSWGYRSIVRTMFGLSVRDTQVGLKLFRREVLEDVLPRLLVKKFAFDIEILAVAHYLGYTKIEEAPINLRFTKWSSITSRNFLKPVGDMLWDTVAVYYRLRILKYYTKKHRKKVYSPDLNFPINLP